MEWEYHPDGINQTKEEIDLPTARSLSRVDGAVEQSRHRGIMTRDRYATLLRSGGYADPDRGQLLRGGGDLREKGVLQRGEFGRGHRLVVPVDEGLLEVHEEPARLGLLGEGVVR